MDGRLGRESAVEHLRRAARLGLDPAILADTALDLLDQQRDPASAAAIFDVAQDTRDHLAVVQPRLSRLQLAEAVLVPAAARRPVEVQVDPSDDPVFASSSTARLLDAQRALHAAATDELHA